ncbi:hypothetical protein [Legionella worsleiensis]|uniref:Uncharacterized protein n=1 Tax=Legionella worsleiensis TaxID=45076 RepID=A0A0W1AJ92_9GAMM|nr:hypothetical protein [Legionella worsleiensis]KTD81403.1 hypothetical protein Lwor_0680 [Legionella worsleiensis]STY30066.1 Uncharacterised protein [Legionella worsleiensis]
MDELIQDEQLSKWFSTYGVITAQRLLGTYQITLPQNELISAIKSPYSFYHQLLQIPLKNVLNGIVLQQAGDYHVYAQKLFIDYLLSGESGKDETSPGAFTRESLEDERQRLVTLGEDYHRLQLEQNKLIANAQARLIQIAEQWRTKFEVTLTQINNSLKDNGLTVNKSTLRSALHYALIHCDYIQAASLGNPSLIVECFNTITKISLNDVLKSKILADMADLLDVVVHFDEQTREFVQENKVLGEQAKSYRTQFYETIIRVTELINLLPEYRIDPEQDAVNKESLYFDKTIGEN